jgi:hypothetical protein
MLRKGRPQNTGFKCAATLLQLWNTRAKTLGWFLSSVHLCFKKSVARAGNEAKPYMEHMERVTPLNLLQSLLFFPRTNPEGIKTCLLALLHK